jgi:hypothetical protein
LEDSTTVPSTSSLSSLKLCSPSLFYYYSKTLIILMIKPFDFSVTEKNFK